MNLMRKAVSALGGIFLAALLIAALAPKATRGIAAALVQVANTSANPVPNQDVDNPGRATIEDIGCNVFSVPGFVGEFICQPSFTVPAGQRLIIDQIEAICETPAGQTILSPGVRWVPNETHFFVLTPAGPGGSGSSQYVLNQSVRYAVDSSSTFTFDMTTNDSTGNTSCSWNMTGHLISFP